MSPNTAGAVLMMASMIAFVMNDTFLKLTGGAVPLFQLIFLRGTLATLLIFLLAHSLGALRKMPSTADLWLISLRGVAEVVTAYFFLNALFNMPLGNLCLLYTSDAADE